MSDNANVELPSVEELADFLHGLSETTSWEADMARLDAEPDRTFDENGEMTPYGEENLTVDVRLHVNKDGEYWTNTGSADYDSRHGDATGASFVTPRMTREEAEERAKELLGDAESMTWEW